MNSKTLAAQTGGSSSVLITIAIPTFNRAHWLKDCVRSALSQTYHNFEVLVSDNASIDETQEVLAELQPHPKLTVVRQHENIGLLPNWNACLNLAKGEYILFLSDDDRLSPFMLAECVKLIKMDSSVNVVMTLSDLYLFSEQRTVAATPNRNFQTGIWDGADLLSECLRDNLLHVMCCIMIRTQALKDRGGFPTNLPNFGADMAGWAPLLMTAHAGFVNKSCAIYTVHDMSETSKRAANDRLDDEWSLSEYIVRLSETLIEHKGRRNALSLQARLYFLRRFLVSITSSRKNGGSLAEALSLLWRWRGAFWRIGPIKIYPLSGRIFNALFPKTYAVIRTFKAGPVSRITGLNITQ